MATWTTITDAALEPGKPIRSVDGLALRDNAIAIAEGAAGAPKIQNAAFDAGELGAEKFQSGTDERDWVLGFIVGSSVGAVGTYAFLASGLLLTLAPGDTRAGSDFDYSSVDSQVNVTPSGTWRCMGYVSGEDNPTLFLRIS